MVFVGEEDGKNGAAAEKILDFEGVDVGVVGGFVVVEHEVDGVGLEAEEEELEDGVVERAVVPEYICVGDVSFECLLDGIEGRDGPR